jgi:hypothetical protein
MREQLTLDEGIPQPLLQSFPSRQLLCFWAFIPLSQRGFISTTWRGACSPPDVGGNVDHQFATFWEPLLSVYALLDCAAPSPCSSGKELSVAGLSVRDGRIGWGCMKTQPIFWVLSSLVKQIGGFHNNCILFKALRKQSWLKDRGGSADLLQVGEPSSWCTLRTSSLHLLSSITQKPGLFYAATSHLPSRCSCPIWPLSPQDTCFSCPSYRFSSEVTPSRTFVITS